MTQQIVPVFFISYLDLFCCGQIVSDGLVQFCFLNYVQSLLYEKSNCKQAYISSNWPREDIDCESHELMFYTGNAKYQI